MSRKILVILPFAAALLAKCQKDNFSVSGNPTQDVVTLQAKNVRDNAATLQGVCNLDPSRVTEYGFIIDTLTLSGREQECKQHPADKIAKEGFSLYITGLSNIDAGNRLGKIYHVRSYLKLTDGKTIWGNHISFRTDMVNFFDPPPPISKFYEAMGTSVVIGVQSMGDMTYDAPANLLLSNMSIRDVKALLADIGVYIWETADSAATVQRYAPLNEIEANAQTIIELKIDARNLRPSTEYTYAGFIVGGVYRHAAYWTVYSPEIFAPSGTFMTKEVVKATLTDVEVTDITATTARLTGKLTDFGNDLDTEVGFFYGDSPTNMTGPHKVELADDNTFSLLVTKLKVSTKYYMQAYASNVAGMYKEETVIAFTTDAPGPPIIDSNTHMELEYRHENFTPNSAKLRCAMLSDGGQNMTAYGVMFGTDPGSLQEKSYTEAYDVSVGYFYIQIDGISSGTDYYYKFYAANASGRVESSVMSVRLPISGFALWYVNPNVTTGYPWQRMTQWNDDNPLHYLTYYEADPIVGTSHTYYFLDRNLGALRPMTWERAQVQTYQAGNPAESVNNYPAPNSQYNYIGYYFNHGRRIPACTPEIINTSGNLTNIGWTGAQDNPAPPFGVDGLSWPDEENPCPEGYVIPTYEQMSEVAARIPAPRQLRQYYDAFRLGISGVKAPGNGNMNNQPRFQDDAAMWMKDANYDKTNSNATNAAVYFCIPYGASGIFREGEVSRMEGVPVRCVRILPNQP